MVISSFHLFSTQIRYRKDKALPKQTPCFPAITGMKDLANGGVIAATIHYYCPQLLRLEGELDLGGGLYGGECWLGLSEPVES